MVRTYSLSLNNNNIEVFRVEDHEITLHAYLHSAFNDLIYQLHHLLHLSLVPVAMDPYSRCSHCAYFAPHYSEQVAV